MKNIYWLNELKKEDISIGGGKAVNLGEILDIGIPVPDGFVVSTAVFDAYTKTIEVESLIEDLSNIGDGIEAAEVAEQYSAKIMERYVDGVITEPIRSEILSSYRILKDKNAHFVAVRSSAITEDMENSSFAGLQDTYLNIKGDSELLNAIKRCWASLYTARVIIYRKKNGIPQKGLKIAVVVQKMVNSTASGVMLTINPTSLQDEIMIEAGLGLGEAIVSGEVTPDNYIVSKGDLEITSKAINKQTMKVVRIPEGGIKRIDPGSEGEMQKVSDRVIVELAKYGMKIEDHYGKPMDIEWAVEGDKIYIVQARAVTTLVKEKKVEMNMNEGRKIFLKGLGASPGKVTGIVRVIKDLKELKGLENGEILVTTMTTPDMVSAMSISKGIITDEGGMTCHAAIVSRELGVPCIVGTQNATKALKTGMEVTMDGSIGTVATPEEKKEEKMDRSRVVYSSVPITATKVMVNIGIPEKAEEYAALPVSGVGLMRVEFILTSYVKEHPLYLIKTNRSKEFVDKMAEGVAKVAKAFYPRPVIVRTSDFKTNEYRSMKGGEEFEPEESNPMIGWRGCSRYVSDKYRTAFLLELEAIKKVREEMGLKNTWVMLPFVRNIYELKKILEMMDAAGLQRNADFKLYLMAEVPSIIFMADEFSKYCDGFSIGSNDLTQLIMGADRDSNILGNMGYFDERYEAIKRAITHLIKVAHENGKVVSICGQAPSVYPEFAEYLVEHGIDSISLNPDTVVNTIGVIASAEQKRILRSIKSSEQYNLTF